MSGKTNLNDVKVTNIVGHLDFDRELDLEAVCELVSGDDRVIETVYEPSENHWLQSWFSNPEGSERYVSFYRSGTAVITGCESEKEFIEFSKLIEDVTSPMITSGVKKSIRNVVVTSSLGYSVDLSELAVLLGLDSVEYEPEQFPALITNSEKDNSSFLVFSSGKIVCTGLSDVQLAEEAIERFSLQLKSKIESS